MFYNISQDNSPKLVFLVCSLSSALAKYGQPTNWAYSVQEIKVLMDHYIDGGAAYCQRFMPNRNLASIRKKAESIGLIMRNAKPWQQDEIDIILRCLCEMPPMKVKGIWHILGENGFSRTYIAVKDKTKELRKNIT